MTVYHPKSNGALERLLRTLAEYLKHYVDEDQTDWDEWIPSAMFTYNTTLRTVTGYTLFELMYGHQTDLPIALTKPKPTYNYDYTQKLKKNLRATNRLAKDTLRKKKLKQSYSMTKKPER